MKIIKLIPLVVAIVISSWTQAESSITGILLDQYGEHISDADIFINDAHVSKSNETGSFNINLNEEINKVKKRKNKPHSQTVKKLGMACSYPGTFNSSIHSIINSTSYSDAILRTIKAGGCHCS